MVAFPRLSCRALTDGEMADIRDEISQVPPGVTFTAEGQPELHGTDGTLHLLVQGNGQSKPFPFPFTHAPNGLWCVIP